MYKTVGILAHVDAGKTTFAESLLYHTKSIRKKGRVDHKDTFLDNHEIEKERGITVFSKQGTFQYGASTYYLIDTPGHVDFSSEMERALLIMDYAIVIISAVEGIQGHTETVWQLLQKYQVPTFFFINKTDRTGADVQKVLEEIKEDLTGDVCYITGNLEHGDMKEELVEFVAERDETLFDLYMLEGYKKELWLEGMRDLIKQNKLFPCASGSALQDIGMTEFLEQMDDLMITSYDEQAPFAGFVYKIAYDEKGTRITHMKALGGKLKVRESLPSKEDCVIIEPSKISQLRLYNGNKFEAVDEVKAGQVFAAVGLTEEQVGKSIGYCDEQVVYEMIPTLKSKVLFDEKTHVKEVLRIFKILDAEDPALYVTWDEAFGAIHIHIRGSIQLEVLKEVVKERFQLEVDFGPCEILYKESIKHEVTGAGHFEPLGHYAEVHLRISPGERDSGIIFESKCHTDHLTIGNQNLVGTHIYERQHHGLLTGSSLTDVKITLVTGRAHNKHTSGGDFREATYRALRQGLEKAENILLEPYYKFKIQASLDYMGRILSDIQKLHGSFEVPQTKGDKVVVMGRAPVVNFMNYSLELAAFTKGRGVISLSFDGYDFCHNQEEVINKIGYEKDADGEYTSCSIFCSKGQAYTVSWNESDAYMHCE